MGGCLCTNWRKLDRSELRLLPDAIANGGSSFYLMALVPDMLPKLGGSHIVFSPHYHPTRECCHHFTDEETKARC